MNWRCDPVGRFDTPENNRFVGCLLKFSTRIDVVNSVVSSPPFVFSPAVASAQTSGPSSSVDSWVGETRREISEIVREVAVAVRKPQSIQHFLAFVADRTLRAMAAEGVVVWRRSPTKSESSGNSTWAVAARLGRVTDLNFTATEQPVHFALLDDIASNGTPVVVPSTPGATHSDVPANPADVPVAIVPIEVQPMETTPVEYLLEVFIEPDGGVATQRGYLRFVAQMADLTAEFLRSDEIRRLKHRRSIQRQLDSILSRVHSSDDANSIGATLVDGIADAFGFDRVGLCHTSGTQAQLVAVSYVDSIAQGSPAAEKLRDASKWANGRSVVPSTHERANKGETSTEDLHVLIVAQSGEKSKLRLVCLAKDRDRELSSDACEDIEHCLHQASIAMSKAARLKVLPGVRRLSSFLVGDEFSVASKRRPASIAFAICLGLVAVMSAFIPVPLTVVASGTLRPSILDNFCAVRSAVVETVHVEHGQAVVAGEPLITLHDDELDQVIRTRIADREGLKAQLDNLKRRLPVAERNRSDESDQLRKELELTEELDGLENELDLLENIQQSLVLKSKNDGIVDAWQIQQRLSGRPLRRGDYLLSVIGRDTSWVVDTKVPQNRISSLQRAQGENTLDVLVTLQTDRDVSWPATMEQIGPGVSSNLNAKPESAVLMSVVDSDDWSTNKNSSYGPLNGSPVQVVCRCGRVTLAYALLQDAIVAFRSNYQMYLGSRSSEQPNRSTSSTSSLLVTSDAK